MATITFSFIGAYVTSSEALKNNLQTAWKCSNVSVR